VIDLSKISFMDSSGMGVVAADHIRAKESSRRFAIAMPPAGVRQAFERTKFSEVVPIAEDLARVYP
jgi:anti-anti-sigma factor